MKTDGIVHAKSSLCHPRANGRVECFKSVLKSNIQLVVQRRSLREAIAEYLGVYRCTRHAATEETPAFLVLGRNHRMRIHLTGRPTAEPHVPRTSVQHNLPHRVKQYQDCLKTYSDKRLAVKQPAFIPGQAFKVNNSSSQGQVTNEVYSSSEHPAASGSSHVPAG